MSLDEIIALQGRAAQAATYVVAMRASVYPDDGWICGIDTGLGKLRGWRGISTRKDLVGWCEAVEKCHALWRKGSAS